MKRTGSAVWQGALTTGKGAVSTQSGILKDTQYSFSSRFESGAGTNPEELIAAAHAGCFSMAFAAALGNEKLTPERISTTATVTVEKVGEGFEITTVHLEMTAKIPGIDQAKFDAVAKGAKENCPVSKVLNAKISLDAKLEA